MYKCLNLCILSTDIVALYATMFIAASVLDITFWGIKRGYDLSFTFSFLFTCEMPGL